MIETFDIPMVDAIDPEVEPKATADQVEKHRKRGSPKAPRKRSAEAIQRRLRKKEIRKAQRQVDQAEKAFSMMGLGK